MKRKIMCLIVVALMVIIPLNIDYNSLSDNSSLVVQNSVTEPITAIKPLQTNMEQMIQIESEPSEEISRGGERKEVEVLSNSSVKTYMNYKMITDETSSQWKYIHESGEIKVCDDGFLRTIDDKYIGIALGSYFKEIGTKWIFTLDTGAELHLIKIEEKADAHTCENGFMQKWDGSVIEFVVDTDKMSYAKEENGLIYSGNFSNNEWLKGNIVKIEEVL